jgi:hypothetical protein
MRDEDIARMVTGNAEVSGVIVRLVTDILVCLAGQPAIDRDLLLRDLRRIPRMASDDAGETVYNRALDEILERLS